MSTRNAISKIRGQEQKILYPQPEGTLGDYMVKHGTDLGEDSLFGQFDCKLLVGIVIYPVYQYRRAQLKGKLECK